MKRYLFKHYTALRILLKTHVFLDSNQVFLITILSTFLTWKFQTWHNDSEPPRFRDEPAVEIAPFHVLQNILGQTHR